ncbi:MAG: siderophore-interacting protein [Nocardioidaceae bacterium]|nr:siderophore-interacting protein [Nocardioidaceae bacterium]
MARELTYSRAEVLRTQRLSPHLVRIEVGGPLMAGWTTTGVPDEAFLLGVPEADGSVVHPDEVPDGEDAYARTRWYTVRRFDAATGTMTFDVVVHDEGVATLWAQRAEVGDQVGVSTTSSWYDRPAEATWQVLFGDVVALPAIGRMIEEAPEGVRTVAHVEVHGPQDELAELGDAVTWHHTPALGRESRLGEIVAATPLPEGPGYVYVAGEAAATRAAKRHLRQECGLPRGTYGVVGYWRARAEEWMRRYETSGIDLEKVYAEGEKAGLDEEQLSDEVDRRLEAAGL